jgi:hypothetical protein
MEGFGDAVYAGRARTGVNKRMVRYAFGPTRLDAMGGQIGPMSALRACLSLWNVPR